MCLEDPWRGERREVCLRMCVSLPPPSGLAFDVVAAEARRKWWDPRRLPPARAGEDQRAPPHLILDPAARGYPVASASAGSLGGTTPSRQYPNPAWRRPPSEARQAEPPTSPGALRDPIVVAAMTLAGAKPIHGTNARLGRRFGLLWLHRMLTGYYRSVPARFVGTR